jgi:REP element-mobilizing transposase RayT
MSEKFQNKYRNGTFRAKWWDYGWNAAYFITICTQNREHFFGHKENGKMILSKTGEIATALWNDIPNHHQFVELGEFVIMPNHIHGILIINKPNMVGSGHKTISKYREKYRFIHGFIL